MGHEKSGMMHRDELIAHATSAALEAKAIRTCDLHEDILIRVGGVDATNSAYAIAMNRRNAGKFSGSSDEVKSAANFALKNAHDECPYCAKLRKK